MNNKTAKAKAREGETKKDWSPSCRFYSKCERLEKEQGRCNPRCCPAYKAKK